MISAEATRGQSPGRVLALVLFVVFAVEGSIMLGLRLLPPAWRGSPLASLLDAVLLTLVIAPAVWMAAVAPLGRMFEARGRLLSRLFSAQEDERGRVARELHDGLGQQLTALMLGLRAVEEAGDLETARTRAHALRDIAARAHADVRGLSRGLHPAILDELGLPSALARLCDDVARAHGVRVELVGADAGRVSAEVETAVYRIAQEALANAAKHGRARELRVELRRAPREVTLTVADDGAGFDPVNLPGRPGLGLASMRERAGALGGTCEIASGPTGTTVTAQLPVPEGA